MPRVARKVAPVVTRKALDTENHKVGQDTTVTMPLTGEPELEREDIEVIEGPRALAKAEELAFMEELVTVEVATTTDKNASMIVEIFNNGRRQNFIRGQPVTCKRKFVEVLARTKPETVRNVEYRDGEGNNSVRWDKTPTLAYPFRVLEDANPRGADWLRKVLAEG